jgi:SAM-dependent methyltransferase
MKIFDQIKDRIFDVPLVFDLVRWSVLGSYKPMRNNLKKFVGLKLSESVLEVGCGTGIFSNLFGENYFGIDFFENFIKIARKKNPKVKFEVMDALNMHIDDKFDKVLLLNFLHHLNDKQVEELLSVIFKYCKGSVIIMEPVPQKYNLIGRFLYSMDRGKFIRKSIDLKTIVSNNAEISKELVFQSFLYKLILLEIRPK